ncbi:hypothetical protein M8J77_017897 [Diaphorina citri]|nr:hypothetical protein M8J77_017897 [Diaphorina citri]
MDQFNKPCALLMTGNVAQNFKDFVRDVKIYFAATETDTKPDGVKVARLKNLMGVEALNQYSARTTIEEGDETMEGVINVLSEICLPKKNEIWDVYQFFDRKQQTGETFDSFYSELRRRVKCCCFDAQEEKLLKVQIVLGVNSKNVQQRLLREDMSLDKMVDYCKSIENAEKKAQVLNSSVDVNYLSSGSGVKPTSSGSKDSRYGVNEKKWVSRPPPPPSPPGFPQSHVREFRPRFHDRCKMCGWFHGANVVCPASRKKCNTCGQRGHFAKVCDKVLLSKKVHVMDGHESSDDELCEYVMNVDSVNVSEVRGESKHKSWMKQVLVNNYPIEFKLDTGSEANILPSKYLHFLKPRPEMKKSNVRLEAYGGNHIFPKGSISVLLETKDRIVQADFLVVDLNSSVPILGLNSCVDLNLIKKVNLLLTGNDDKSKFVNKNSDVFTGIGCFPDQCSLQLKEGAIPKASPCRRVPIKIKDRLKDTLDALVSKGIIEPVDEPSEWVSNMIAVEKPDKSLRICIDPVELNKYLVREYYTIPTHEDILPNLANKRYYCVFDLKDGFHQIKMDKESSKLCTFSTPFGCYRYLRAPFGLSVIPEKFQKLTFKYFGNINGVTVYFDDILCAAETKEELDQIIEEVLRVARKYNIKFNPTKLQYHVESVKYLGQIFDVHGYRPDPNRVTAIQNLKAPTCKKELQSILGILNYLRNFIPNMSALTAQLRELLKSNVEWSWTSAHDQMLSKLKDSVSEVTKLAHFDPTQTVQIQCDASKDALGCCLLQNNRPVSYASRNLTAAERNYAQIEKELLAVVFAFSKFHNFVYGNHNITVMTDHSPLVSIVKKNMGDIKNNRLKRLLIKLLPYSFQLNYLPGKFMYVADLLSRNFEKELVEDDLSMNDMVHVLTEFIAEISEERFDQFQKETKLDAVLSKVLEFYNSGWPNSVSGGGELSHFFRLRNEITVDKGIVYYNRRMVVPVSLRRFTIDLLHETHLGKQKILGQVKNLFYWPGITSDISSVIDSCATCQRFKRAKIKEPLVSHEIPNIPFHKVGIDIAHWAGTDYLVLVDYHSRWIEVRKMLNKSSTEVINCLKRIFCVHGVPAEVICDNNPFSSYEMSKFAGEYNFKVTTASPHHCQSRGMVEKAVGIVKDMFKKCTYEGKDINLYLLNYRNSPVAGLPWSPSQLLFSRNLRSKLPVPTNHLLPAVVDPSRVSTEMSRHQNDQASWYNKTSTKKSTEFQIGDQVLVRNIKTKVWERGEVIERLGFRSYKIRFVNGNILRRNAVYMRQFKCESPVNDVNDYVLSEDEASHIDDHIDDDEELQEELPLPSDQEDEGSPSSGPTSRFGRPLRQPDRWTYN